MSSTAIQASRNSVDRFGADWHGKTVLVVGLGRSGQAASRLLLRLGARVRATDSQTTDALQVTALELQTAGVERIELGKHSRAMLDGLEAVVVSPGVPESSPALVWAREARVPILSEIELAFLFCPCPIVGVTGTNGKSSVVTMIAQVAQAAGRRAVACGNVGIPFSSVLPQLTSDSLAVVEVSSFQLLGCRVFRPAIAVLLNIGTNHLDRHARHDDYVAAKARLFASQTPEDHAVLNAADAEVVRLSGGIRAGLLWFGTAGDEAASAFALHPATCRALPPSQQAVLQVARLLGIPDPLSYQVLRSFRGLEHRLEYVGSIRGITCVNDSKSTTPDSLLYALTRVAGSVMPIIGGKDKGMDFSSLKTALADPRVRGVVLIGETRPQLRALLMDTTTLRESDTLEQAVEAALALGQPGDTLLLSPACASFDMFRDFEERGRAFKTLINHMADDRA